MSKTNVTFYRGCHGMGICIMVSCGKDRVIFDFGAPFEPFTDVYDGTILKRNKHRIYDAIVLGKACKIDGIYPQKDIYELDVIPYEQSDYNTGILVCHLHLDHMSEIDKVHPDVPVYIHEDGLKLNQIIDEMEENGNYRSYSPFRYDESFNIGSIKITPFFSDHTCIGSASFLIETEDARIIYSGDIRYHGVNNEKAYKEIERFKDENIDLLIVDSTTTSPSEFIYKEELKDRYLSPNKDILPGYVTEQDLYDDIISSLDGFDGLGVINMFPRDISMLKNIYGCAVSLNREAVFEPYYANILYKLTGIAPSVIYRPMDLKKPCFDELTKACKQVSYDDIKNEPHKYLIQNSYKRILDLIEYDGIDGKYFHLMGEPLVEGTKDYKVMLNFVNKLKWEFKTYINLYSFSHAYPNHLAYVVDTINAKTVVAVHSKHPENLNPCRSIQFFPVEGMEYTLDNGELKER